MLVEDALKHFNGSKAKMAAAAGSNYSAVYNQWGTVVPWSSAWLLHVNTKGALKVNLKYYDGKNIKPEHRREDVYMKQYRAKKKQEAEKKKAP